MSVPKSKVLKCNGGFLAQADVPVNSPSQSQSTNINVLVNPYDSQTIDKDKLATKEYYPEINIHDTADLENPRGFFAKQKDESQPSDRPMGSSSPSEFKPPVIQTRDIDSAKLQLDDLQKLISNQKDLITALNLLLDMYENNPLIINKYIVADSISLKELIKLLTSANKVELNIADAEVNCGCNPKYQYISKIIIKKDNTTYNLKYHFSDVIQFLDKHRISYKICC